MFRAAGRHLQEMRDAINAWRDTYLKREGDKASDPCMRMAYVIVHKLQKGVFAEYSSDILDKEKTAKGKWMDRNLSQLDLIRDSVLQWMLIGGECWVKPVPRARPRWQHDFCAAARTQDRRRDPGA